MKKAKILIVGAGSIGTRHIRNLLSLGYRNLVVCDSSKEKVKEISKLGILRMYEDVHKALATEKPDIVFVCNPTHLHIPTAALSLDAGAHIFIEKPISHTLQGVDALHTVVTTNKKVAMVACNFRFSKGFRKLENILRKHVYGTPLLCRVALGYYLPTARKGVSHTTTYAAGKIGGGVVLDSGSHVVEYLADLFGSVKVSNVVKGTTRTIGIEGEETAGMLLKHANGVLSSISLDYVSRKSIHRLEILTEKGTLVLDFRGDTLVYEAENKTRLLYKGDGDLNLMFLEEVKHFMKCITDGSKPKQDILEAKKTLKVLLGDID